jgi:hypothetical protein
MSLEKYDIKYYYMNLYNFFAAGIGADLGIRGISGMACPCREKKRLGRLGGAIPKSTKPNFTLVRTTRLASCLSNDP